jgi:hypothetical protein
LAKAEIVSTLSIQALSMKGIPFTHRHEVSNSAKPSRWVDKEAKSLLHLVCFTATHSIVW